MVRRSTLQTGEPLNLPSGNGARMEAVQGFFQAAQMGCVMAGQYSDAAAIGMHGDNISNEITGLADKYPAIGKALDTLVQAGPFAGLLTAVMPLALQIAANHKRIPADKVPGVLPPEALEMQMKAEVATMAAQQARQAQEAQREYERVMTELHASETAQDGTGTPRETQPA